MMAGNITAICFGAMAAVIVSLCTRGRMTAEEVEAEWEKTRDIDNPLNPWVEVYKGKNKSILGYDNQFQMLEVFFGFTSFSISMGRPAGCCGTKAM